MKKLLTLFAMSLFAVGMSAQRWVPIVQNSDMEGTENANFVAKESNGPTEPATIIDGIGVDGSRGVQVVSAPGAGQDWDTQFWIVFESLVGARTPTLIRNGKPMKVPLPWEVAWPMVVTEEVSCQSPSTSQPFVMQRLPTTSITSM